MLRSHQVKDAKELKLYVEGTIAWRLSPEYLEDVD